MTTNDHKEVPRVNIQRGYCGLKCGECPAHIAMETDDDALRAKTAAEWNAQHGSDMKPEEINCAGCRDEDAAPGHS